MKHARLFTMCGALVMALSSYAQVKINVNVAKTKTVIGDNHYGIFFEDINHAADGGLYAELIRNRSFEDNSKRAEGWSAVSRRGASVEMNLVSSKLLNNAQGQALKMSVTGATPDNLAGISNSGFWGVNVVNGRHYSLTFWARADKKYKGTIKVALQSAYGSKTYGEAIVKGNVNKEWQKFSAEIVANADDANARFALLLDTDAEIMLDVVSLFPPTYKNRPNGCRPDLAQLLADMKPRFMRFPGGCFVEGQDGPENAFHWQSTVGPIEQRPGHENVNWGYRTSDGMGYHEFLQLSEDLGAKPLYVVNVGIWHGGFTPVDSIQPWIDEALSAIEYANGDITTKYGKMRAENGHPEPFNLRFVEIGNENYQPGNNALSDNYPSRYRRFYNAIKKAYPNITLIGNVAAWGTDNPKWLNGYPVEMVDEHYYRNPSWFAAAYNKYDSYDRKGPKIYAGEYAVTQNFGTTGNLSAALGEAVYMMGMENNADIVKMASYAPIFVNENDVRWQPDMIRFNSSDVCCTPSYYVQKLFSENVGTRVVDTRLTDASPKVDPKPFNVGLGTWRTAAKFDSAFVYVAGKRLMEENFDNKKSWQDIEGNWTIKAGKYEQSNRKQEGAVALWDKKLNVSKYSYRVKAFKTTGDEGVLIVLNYMDSDNFAWVNIGGWNNTSCGIEQSINGSRLTLSSQDFVMETGKWYDITVNVDGDDVSCMVDDKIVCSATLYKPFGLFANSTFNDENGDLCVKIVNFGGEKKSAELMLKGIANASSAQLVRLTSKSGSDENTMRNSQNVVPTENELVLQSNKLQIDVPANSLNIVKIKTK